MDSFRQDIRQGWRLVLRHRRQSVLAVAMLALGIGGSVTMYSVLLPVLLPYPRVPEPKQLARLWATHESFRIDRNKVSLADFYDWNDRIRNLESMAAYRDASPLVRLAGEPRNVWTLEVTPDYFRVLRARPVEGRFFLPADVDVNAERVAVIGETLRRRAFGSESEAVGETLWLDELPHTVIGVAPAGVGFLGSSPELWVPVRPGEPDLRREARLFMVLARLQEGGAWKEAELELQNVARSLEQAYPASNRGWSARIIPLADEVGKRAGQGIVFFLGPAIFVLLIGCVNTANLLLARAAAREKELAVRSALGASRLRLVRQLLTEGLLLGLSAGAAGVLLSLAVLPGIRRLFAAATPAGAADAIAAISVNSSVLLFAVLLSLVTPVLFGLAPALVATRLDQVEVLKDGRRRPVLTRGRYGVSDLFVVLGMVLAVPFLVMTVATLSVFARMEDIAPGFDTSRLYTLQVSLPEGLYNDPARVQRFLAEAGDSLRQLPSVLEVGGLTAFPEGTERSRPRTLTVEADAPVQTAGPYQAETVAPGTLEMLGIPLLQGRLLSERDGTGTEPVAVVSRGFAGAYLPGMNPVGRRIKLGAAEGPEPWLRVVGVTEDIMVNRKLERADPLVYLPAGQTPARTFTLLLRVAADPFESHPEVKAAFWRVESRVPVADPISFEARMERRYREPRFILGLIGSFSVLAFLLAALGLYASLRYIVARRRREFGVRRALGAPTSDILRLVVGRGMTLAAAGLGMGMAVALAVVRLIRSEMAEFLPNVPLLLTATLGGLLLVALVACLEPAWAAGRVEPMEVLRTE